MLGKWSSRQGFLGVKTKQQDSRACTQGQTRASGWGGEAGEEEKPGCGSMVCLNQFVICCHEGPIPPSPPSPPTPGPGGPAGPGGLRTAGGNRIRSRAVSWRPGHGWEWGGGDSWRQDGNGAGIWCLLALKGRVLLLHSSSSWAPMMVPQAAWNCDWRALWVTGRGMRAQVGVMVCSILLWGEGALWGV